MLTVDKRPRSWVLDGWADNRGVELDFIDPGKPTQNTYGCAARFGVTQRGIWQAFRELGGALKHPKTDDDKRRVFQEKIKACKDEGKPIVYIDESSFAHDLPRPLPQGAEV